MCFIWAGELSSKGGDNYTYSHVCSLKSDKKTDKKAEKPLK